jgi:pectin methylesterase-like acyl-CoA thioesterase
MSSEGYKDTLYAKNNKKLYQECRKGTVDFIFDNATMVF